MLAHLDLVVDLAGWKFARTSLSIIADTQLIRAHRRNSLQARKYRLLLSTLELWKSSNSLLLNHYRYFLETYVV